MFFCLYRASHTGLLRSPSLIHVGELVRGAENALVGRVGNPCKGFVYDPCMGYEGNACMGLRGNPC